MDLQKKEDIALRLLAAAQKSAGDNPVEISYSGGKDSDVILHLARKAGINARPIYKNTTIDPPGTIAHVISKGVEIMEPKTTFLKLIDRKGLPTRWSRYCCSVLKEYKIEDVAVQGIRRCESVKRAARYKEPEVCRIYSGTSEARVFLPILEWTNADVERYIAQENIECHPLYYDASGRFCVKRRLGCIGCPLAMDRGTRDFRRYPKMLRAWLKHLSVWYQRPNIKSRETFGGDIYAHMAFHLFYKSMQEFRQASHGLGAVTDWKRALEDYFRFDLTI